MLGFQILCISTTQTALKVSCDSWLNFFSYMVGILDFYLTLNVFIFWQVENPEQFEDATSPFSCRCFWVIDSWFCILLDDKIVWNYYLRTFHKSTVIFVAYCFDCLWLNSFVYFEILRLQLQLQILKMHFTNVSIVVALTFHGNSSCIILKMPIVNLYVELITLSEVWRLLHYHWRTPFW